jgi:hypothetical protein
MNIEHGSEQARSYRFGQLRRSGLFGSLPLTLLVPVAVALVAGWVTVAGLVPAPIGVVVVAAGLGVAFARVRGRPLHVVAPALIRWWWRRLGSRHCWLRPVPLVSDGNMPAAVPAPLDGLGLVEIDLPLTTLGRRHRLGVVHDRAAGTVTGVLRVAGDGQFSLADPRSQDLRLEGWGAALGGFAREQATVARVTWRDWSAPVAVHEQVGALQARWADEPETPARTAYFELMDEVAPRVVHHDVVVEVTVEVPTSRGARRWGERSLTAAVKTLCDELGLLQERLDAAGLQVVGVLSAAEVVTAMRVRSDPSVLEQLAVLRQSIAAACGEAAPNFGPMTIDDALTSVRVDRAVHRSWWFARWPRREVPAGWMDRLIFETGCTRTISVVFEPVPPSRSDHAVDRELVHREANIESRHRRQFRVTGKDRKALDEAQTREAELNAGFPELFYVGLVTLTASDEPTLERQAAQLEQVAAQVGVELEPLWGQQAAGWVASLPLGRTLARRLVTTW